MNRLNGHRRSSFLMIQIEYFLFDPKHPQRFYVLMCRIETIGHFLKLISQLISGHCLMLISVQGTDRLLTDGLRTPLTDWKLYNIKIKNYSIEVVQNLSNQEKTKYEPF